MKPQPHEPQGRACPDGVRRDGWTPHRQLVFLDMLARTGSVTRSARAAGMSRESAYRLRARNPDGLFAAAWDRALAGHRTVNLAAARGRRRGVIFGGFPEACTEGHEMDGLRPRARHRQVRDPAAQVQGWRAGPLAAGGGGASDGGK